MHASNLRRIQRTSAYNIYQPQQYDCSLWQQSIPIQLNCIIIKIVIIRYPVIYISKNLTLTLDPNPRFYQVKLKMQYEFYAQLLSVNAQF